MPMSKKTGCGICGLNYNGAAKVCKCTAQERQEHKKCTEGTQQSLQAKLFKRCSKAEQGDEKQMDNFEKRHYIGYHKIEKGHCEKGRVDKAKPAVHEKKK